jgi:CubicO group peptidase (beta-lactamase class C family)
MQVVFCRIVLLYGVVTMHSALAWSGIATNGFSDLREFLEPLRAKYKLPALAAAVVTKDKLLACGVTGVRKTGSKVAVELNDKFHIGSCTKSMTALLGALLIHEGKLSANTTVGEMFPNWEIPDEVKKITFAQLLAHQSGIPHKPSEDLWEAAYHLEGTPTQQREHFLQAALREPLEAHPGERFIYSNTGYALAGVMIEKAAGISWEKLIEQRIFEPLGMSTAGFGPPSTSGKIDQPWGHHWKRKKPRSVPPADNPPAIAPAGAVHCSIIDLARYTAFHLTAIAGRIPEIDSTLRDFLYAPIEGGNYSGGWVVVKRPWAGGIALTHSGSNTMFYTVIWLAPARDLGFIVCTNVGDTETEKISSTAGDAVISALIARYNK